MLAFVPREPTLAAQFLRRVALHLADGARDPRAIADRWRWDLIARPEQRWPAGEWSVWVMKPGRAWGKTRAAAEAIREQVVAGRAHRIALVGATAAATSKVMVRGISGLLNIGPPEQRPRYIKSDSMLIWPERYFDAQANLYSAEEPERLRGPEHDLAWADEVDAWAYTGTNAMKTRAREAFDNLWFSLRGGTDPRLVVTSTPKPGRLIAQLLADRDRYGDVHVTTGSTYENRANLSAKYLRSLEMRYEGTVYGQQELHGELLASTEARLWRPEMLDAPRMRWSDLADERIEMQRVVVAIDPAGSMHEGSAETGIVGAGAANGIGYVLADRSRRALPEVWAATAVALYHELSADAIVAEVNHGGDMVAATIRAVAPNVPVIQVRASRGKSVRAEPVAALYAAGKVRHVGTFPKLERQMLDMGLEGYEPGAAAAEDPDASPSPDRADAAVWALTELLLQPEPDGQAAPPAAFTGRRRPRGDTP